MNTTYVAADPGKTGCMALLEISNTDQSVVSIELIPFSEKAYKDKLIAVSLLGRKCKGMIEKVNARPGQGIQAMFNFGANYGFIQGLYQAFSIPYQLVPPQTWKKEFGLIGKDKKESVKVCQRLFPTANLLPTPRSKVPSDDFAEALLMAEYTRRKL